jgi:8-oxo-dGTP pyrophosphatase MutT (NUDIX family)
MEVHFSRGQEAALNRIAHREGKVDASELLKEAALRLLSEEARFRAAVLQGKTYADRGEFIEEEEMDAGFEEMLRP